MRPLSEGEKRLAKGVFGDAIDLDRVRLAPHLPGRTAVTLGSTVVLPVDSPADFSKEPATAQGWLIHELTHVWQFQTRAGRTVLSWAKVAATGGYRRGSPGYDYRHPFEWERLNLEQQASVVEHAFLLRSGVATAGMAHGPAVTLADYVGRTPFEDLTRRG